MKQVKLVAALAFSLLTSCSIPLGSSPLAFAGSWQLEPGLYVETSPQPDGSFEIDIVGEGVIADNVFVKNGGVEYVSPKTGIRYRVEPGRDGGKPTFMLIGPGRPEPINPENLPVVTAEK